MTVFDFALTVIFQTAYGHMGWFHIISILSLLAMAIYFLNKAGFCPSSLASGSMNIISL